MRISLQVTTTTMLITAGFYTRLEIEARLAETSLFLSRNRFTTPTVILRLAKMEGVMMSALECFHHAARYEEKAEEAQDAADIEDVSHPARRRNHVQT